MTVKRLVSHESFGYYRLVSRARLIFALLFSMLMFFMFAYSLISNTSMQSAAFTERQDSQVLQSLKVVRKFTDVANPAVPLINVSKQKKKVEVDSGNDQIVMISPPLVKEEGRKIGRFRGRKLPEFEIFRSDNLTRKFHGRVLEFFNNKCDVQFFMTWISKADSFGSREILAVESVFKSNPHGCLMILSRTMDSVQGYRILKPMLDRGFKAVAITPDLPFLLKNTPAKAWFDDMKRGKKDPGEIPLAQNLSNLMRLAVLYKYGGVYLDTDFIVLRSFKGLKNTIGAQSVDMVSKKWTRLNNAALVFDMNHPLLFKFLEEFAVTFNGNKWGHNGPYMVSRVIQRMEGRGGGGYNFSILPPMAFYPVDWIKIGRLFKMPKDRAGSRWVEAKVQQLKGESYGVHLWNKQSSKLMVEEGSVMGRLMSENCLLCENVYSS